MTTSFDGENNDVNFNFINKLEHQLYSSSDAEDFRIRFKSEVHCSVEQVFESIVQPVAKATVYLTGSIPQRAASGRSDVDLILVVMSPEAVLSSAFTDRGTPNHIAFRRPDDPLWAGQIIKMFRHVEVDVNVLLSTGISQIYENLLRPGPDLSDREIMLLSRLKTGWCVAQLNGGSDVPPETFSRRLDIYCLTRAYTLAIKMFEKCVKEAQGSFLFTALHFGRLAVEQAYFAYFATLGFSYIGTKWMRIVEGRAGQNHPLAHIANDKDVSSGLSLIFPSPAWGVRETSAYITDVRDFLVAIRLHIARDPIAAIALKACPQVYAIESVIGIPSDLHKTST